MPRPANRSLPCLPFLLALAAGATATPVSAQSATGVTVTVVVSGQSAKGTVAGALFATADGFPTKDAAAQQRLMVPATAGSDTLVFRNVAPGRYAVAVYVDANGNTKLDTNMFGVPKEAWGVTGGARPAMRSPRFEEAAFEVRANTTVMVTVR